MSQATPAVAARVLDRWDALATGAAQAHGFPKWLVLAVIAQESAGDTYAWRPEPGFLDRYRTGIDGALAGVGEKRYQRWWRNDPMVLATSFGLAQVLVVVAIERGMNLPYPSSLCDPERGIEAGCRQLRYCFDRTKGATEPRQAALLRYNGGGNPDYPEEVERWSVMLMEVARA